MKTNRSKVKATIRRINRKNARKFNKQLRCYATHFGGDWILWECERHGHRFRKTVKAATGNKFVQNMIEVFCAPGGYWTREQDGAYVSCPECLKVRYQLIDGKLAW